jgi:chlorite dismutase
MEIVNFQKETSEQSGLRLVADAKDVTELSAIDKQFVNFTFLRVNPEWRRLDENTKSECRAEFMSVFESFRAGLLMFSYSLVGFDSKADLLFWRIGDSLDLIQELTAKLYRTRLGSFFETVDNYLSIAYTFPREPRNICFFTLVRRAKTGTKKAKRNAMH